MTGEIGSGLTKTYSKRTDFFRGAKTTGRDFLGKFSLFIRRKVIVHGGINYTAGNGIDVYAARGKFFCECLCKSVHTGF